MGVRTAAVLLSLSLCARAEDQPLAPGVTVEVRSEGTEFAIGDPILLDVVYRNDGEATWQVGEGHTLEFGACFDVRDAEGARVLNPYSYDKLSMGGKCTEHRLPPGGALTFRRYANESAAFEKPGEYALSPRGWVSEMRDGKTRSFRCATRPLTIRILPAPDKKGRDAIVNDLTWLWHVPGLRDSPAYDRYRPYLSAHNARTDVLRLLAFRREQALLPFWIERLDDLTDKNRRFDSAYAPEALAGLPDRAAVLRALEEQLARGKLDHFLPLYLSLAVPKTDDLDWKDVLARRAAIERRYRGK